MSSCIRRGTPGEPRRRPGRADRRRRGAGPRPLKRGGRASAGQATAEAVEQIVVQHDKLKGAAAKIGQVISTAELLGMETEAGERIQRRLAELRDSAPTVEVPSSRS